ncbi:hypothetical protein HOY80DRAFT_992539 [Tuber brumale]|nr:hypothetical protein HOY80DRAFT_992539 [Tuber brumale]
MHCNVLPRLSHSGLVLMWQMWTSFDGQVPATLCLISASDRRVQQSQCTVHIAMHCACTPPTFLCGLVMMWQMWTAFGGGIPATSYLVLALERRVQQSWCTVRIGMHHTYAPSTFPWRIINDVADVDSVWWRDSYYIVPSLGIRPKGATIPVHYTHRNTLSLHSSDFPVTW